MKKWRKFPTAVCATAADQINLMSYHCRHVEGCQSDKLMRLKIFSLLESELQKLPKTWSNSHAKKHIQDKWLDAMSVLLFTLNNQQDWIKWKVYGPEDFEYFIEVSKRVKVTLSHMIKDNVFDSKDMYKMLAFFLRQIEMITEFHNDRMARHDSFDLEPIFENTVSKYEKLVESLHEKYGEPDAVSEDEDEEDYEEDEDEESEQVEVPPIAVTPTSQTDTATAVATSVSGRVIPKKPVATRGVPVTMPTAVTPTVSSVADRPAAARVVTTKAALSSDNSKDKKTKRCRLE